MQTAETCSQIRQLVAGYLADSLRISARRDGFNITLPLKAVDDRWVSVIIEEKYGDYFTVHDGGKTDSVLFSHGLKMSESDEQFRAAVAAKYGVSVQDRLVQKTCRRDNLPETIMAVAESAAVMTAQLVSSRLVEVEVQEVHDIVSEALLLWKPEDIVIEQNVEIPGSASTHQFDFIARSGTSEHRTTTIKILPPSRPRERAERYGYMRYDMLRKPQYENWANLAVILGADTWSKPALDIVQRIADSTIELKSDQQTEVAAYIPKAMSMLTEVAL